MLFAMVLFAAVPAAPDFSLAPTPLFETLGVEQGLPSSKVYEMAQDRQGFLWIATADGLARYDGVGFAIWRRDPADHNQISRVSAGSTLS